MNQSAIPEAIEKLLDQRFEPSELSFSKWLEKPAQNGNVLRIILNSENECLDFSWGTGGLAIECCEIRFHLKGATAISFGGTLRLVERSGFTVHLSHGEGRIALFAWLPPDE